MSLWAISTISTLLQHNSVKRVIQFSQDTCKNKDKGCDLLKSPDFYTYKKDPNDLTCVSSRVLVEISQTLLRFAKKLLQGKVRNAIVDSTSLLKQN